MIAVPCVMLPEETIIEQEPEKEGEEAQDPESITPKEARLFFSGKKINRNFSRDMVPNLSKACLL